MCVLYWHAEEEYDKHKIVSITTCLIHANVSHGCCICLRSLKKLLVNSHVDDTSDAEIDQSKHTHAVNVCFCPQKRNKFSLPKFVGIFFLSFFLCCLTVYGIVHHHQQRNWMCCTSSTQRRPVYAYMAYNMYNNNNNNQFLPRYQDTYTESNARNEVTSNTKWSCQCKHASKAKQIFSFSFSLHLAVSSKVLYKQ